MYLMRLSALSFRRLSKQKIKVQIFSIHMPFAPFSPITFQQLMLSKGNEGAQQTSWGQLRTKLPQDFYLAESLFARGDSITLLIVRESGRPEDCPLSFFFLPFFFSLQVLSLYTTRRVMTMALSVV